MVTPAPTRFRHARLYITFRCNARCGYCNVWQDPVFFGHTELDADGLRRALDQVRELGVEYVDFTGGEPALHRDLATAVRYARELGLSADVTTNAIRFDQHADEIVPFVDTLNISLDTLSAERYHAVRGTDTLHRTLALVERLSAQGVCNLKLIAVVTRETLPGIDELIGFAQSVRIPLYLSPVWEYFPEQAEQLDGPARLHLTRLRAAHRRDAQAAGEPRPERPRIPDGAQASIADALRAHTHTPFTVVSLDALHHMETLDPSTPTACSAGSRIVTIGPDGRLLLPCYHEWNSSLAWERPYLDLVEDPEFVRVRDEEVGKLAGCRRCAVHPYLGLATSYRLTQRFLLQAMAEEITKLKRCLERSEVPWQLDAAELSQAREHLLGRLGRLTLRAGTHFDELYVFTAVAGEGIRSDLSPRPIAVQELLADHAHEDCWRTQRTPHRLARLLYVDIVPALASLSEQGVSGAREAAAGSLRAQLALWEAWLDLVPFAGTGGPSGRGLEYLARWCENAGNLLAAHGRIAALRSLCMLGLLSDIPVDVLLSWGGVDGHPDELLAAKLLSESLAPARRRALAPCFSEQVAEALAAPQRPAYPPTNGEADSGVDLARAAAGDPAALQALCALAWRHAVEGATRELRTLVRRWKTTSRDDPDQVERALLRLELGITTPSACV
jgi:MoaA/NifB/PqqE/SkfB family radical SAM enzyme